MLTSGPVQGLAFLASPTPTGAASASGSSPTPSDATPASSPSPTSSGTVAPSSGSAEQPLVIGATAFFIGIVLLAVASVVGFRFFQSKTKEQSTSLTRPLLALLLVGAVVVLAILSLGMGDDTSHIREALIGAVVSLSSAAAAFYFASSSGGEARRDILTATSQAMIFAPNLVGMTFEDARSFIAQTGFSLKLHDPTVDPKAKIASQTPSAGSQISPSQEFEVS